MTGFKKIMVISASVVIGCSMMISPAMAKQDRHNKARFAKNIIFMVPDGQGLSNVTAGRIFKNGLDGAPLRQETLEQIGYQRTHSANATVTDSAAAGSAWASGQKFINGEVSCHGSADDGSCSNQVPTILELAEAKGKATGLVATSQISHATPAVFGAHVFSRNCGLEIARQYIADTKVDVILGGGIYKADPPPYCDVYPESYNQPDKRQYIIDLAIADGYTFVSDKDQLGAAAADDAKKVLGMFEQNGIGRGKTVEHFWVDGTPFPAGEPTLAEMTAAALDILEEDQDGMFLMVEGSQVDWENHGNRVEGQIAETLGFDAAVEVVMDWVEAKQSRKNHTLVIIVADHNTGGFDINGPGNSLTQQGEIVLDGWTSGGHTAEDTIIYSQGPGSELLGAALDNTDLYYVMKDVLR